MYPESRPHQNSLTATAHAWHREYKCSGEMNMAMLKATGAQEPPKKRELWKGKGSVRETLMLLFSAEAQSTDREACGFSTSWYPLACDWSFGPALLFSDLHLLSLFVKVVELQFGVALRATWSKSTVGTWADASTVQLVLQTGLGAPLRHG